MVPLTLDPDTTRATLALVAEARRSGPLVDMHVHPFDVLVGGHLYREEQEQPGVFGAYQADYRPPRRGKVATEPNAAFASGQSPDLAAKFFLLTVRQSYAHIGPGVLADHLDLALIDRCLLLPVARAGEDGQLSRMAEMFGDDPRFVFGYGVPDGVEDGAIGDAVAAAVAEYHVRVLKIHPGVSRVDVRERSSLARVERILTASRDQGLGVVVHGGLSPHASAPEAVAFGTLDRLERVDWGITGAPVVIAHAGAYGYPAADLGSEVLPGLERLLARHDHLRVDVAGLGTEAMTSILERVELSRILFGSDALYYSPWGTMVRLALALEAAGIDVVDGLTAIAGRNPAEILGPGEKTR
jgi:predicted TIM-barrel fold metal-dependent hydrolase